MLRCCIFVVCAKACTAGSTQVQLNTYSATQHLQRRGRTPAAAGNGGPMMPLRPRRPTSWWRSCGRYICTRVACAASTVAWWRLCCGTSRPGSQWEGAWNGWLCGRDSARVWRGGKLFQARRPRVLELQAPDENDSSGTRLHRPVLVLRGAQVLAACGGATR